jgi:hypothetical protein
LGFAHASEIGTVTDRVSTAGLEIAGPSVEANLSGRVLRRWYRSVHMESFDAHRARALLGTRAQIVGMTNRMSNHIRGVHGLRFDRRVEILTADRADTAPIVRPCWMPGGNSASRFRPFTPARTLMYEAAVVLMTRAKQASSLKYWADTIAERSRARKARLALARKLSVILHSIWRSRGRVQLLQACDPGLTNFY